MSLQDQLEALTRDGNPDKLLTKEQAAELLEVTPLRIWKWGKSGKLARVVLGEHTIRYRMSDVRQLIRESLDTS